MKWFAVNHHADTCDAGGSAVELHEVTFIRADRELLSDISLRVGRGEQWALIGPNGAGKSTLLGLCGAVTFPSRGWVQVLGHRLGEIDLRELRRSIGFVNPRHPLRSNATAHDVVLTGATGTIELVPRWAPSEAELNRARRLEEVVGLENPHELRWHTMSQGERGRALIARALMSQPPLVLLDEPSTGLDIAAREQMLSLLADLPNLHPDLTTVTVTHHLEELPTSTTHAALLQRGRIVAAGAVEDVLTSAKVTDCFDHPIDVERRRGRWQALAH